MKNWEANLPKYLANEVLPEPMQTKEAREQVKMILRLLLGGQN